MHRADTIDLGDHIRLPETMGAGTYKCRVEYGEEVAAIEFIPYHRKEARSLTLVTCDTIEYGHKFTDRHAIDTLLQNIRTDDILIVKNGLITDSSIANVAFYDGVKWITPSTPLLAGTARARYLDKGVVVTGEIRPSDLRFFTKAVLFNAMVEFNASKTLGIDRIL